MSLLTWRVAYFSQRAEAAEKLHKICQSDLKEIVSEHAVLTKMLAKRSAAGTE